jgi:RNA polymerase sigma-70 factor (ECF subfamily)
LTILTQDEGMTPHQVEAFKLQLVDLRPALRAFAQTLARNHAQAEDLTQDTIVKALVNMDKFIPGTNLRAWLFVIMRNHHYSKLRKAKREIEDPDGVIASYEGKLGDQNPVADLKDTLVAMESLSPEHRKAIELVAFQDLSLAEAAKVMGIQEGTVKSRLNRGRHKLKQLLGMTSIAERHEVS